MESITTDYRVSNKLNIYFEDKIKIIFSSKVNVIIVTKDYKVYKFNNEICERISTSNDNTEIEAALFKGLCGEKIVDFANSNNHAVALNEDGRLFSWSFGKYMENCETFAKICGFGLALHKSDDEKHTIDREANKYEASEVIKSSNYTTKADIYSIGKIIFLFLREMFFLTISLNLLILLNLLRT